MDLQAHFSLRKIPFTREISVNDMFEHPQREEIIVNLTRTVEQRMSAALVAPAGYGKTALVRTMRHRLSDVRYRVHYVKGSCLSKRDMCREIAKCLGLAEVGTYPRLLRLVQDSVDTRSHRDGVRTVFILDDAHEMRPQVLGMLKTLTNFDMDSRLVLSILLIGQLPLTKLLRRADLEDIAQRLSWYGVLRALSRDETVSYLKHRCRIAGATREIFDERSRETIYEMCLGNFRATDHLARRALEVAHQANETTVSMNHVIEARSSLQL